MIRCILILSIAVCGIVQSFASPSNVKVVVDERFELNSIVWRLAGAKEYSQCDVAVYAAEVDSFFAPYASHPIVDYCKTIRDSTGIGYDAISTASSFMRISDGAIVLTSDTMPQYLAVKDKRWTAAMYEEYVRLLDDFYRSSHFNKFFTEHQWLYQLAESEFKKNVMQAGTKWFDDFWGIPIDSYVIFLSITNGPSNYGNISVPGYDNGILMGCCYSTDSVAATYNSSAFNVMLHELMHKVANPIASQYRQLFDAQIDTIFPVIKDALMMGAYGRESVIPEWFTRMGTLCYLWHNNRDSLTISNMLTNDMAVGFRWQRDAFRLMRDSFDTARDRYPHFEDFIPRLASFLTDYVADTAHLQPAPSVVNVWYNVDDTIVLSQTDTLKVYFQFSCDMNPTGGVQSGPEDENIDNATLDKFFRINKEMTYAQRFQWIDKRTFTALVPSEYLHELPSFTIRLFLHTFESTERIPGVGYPTVKLPIRE